MSVALLVIDVQRALCEGETATDSFHRTELAAVLERHGVTSLAVCGMQSDFCVDTTTRCALALGYPVQVIADGHTTVDDGVRAVAVTAAEVDFDR